jgi:purine-nucleoside phosphorylase
MAFSVMSGLRDALETVDHRADKPTACLGFVLGSGLGGLAAEVQDAVRIPFAEIPGIPAATVVGHAGELVLGTWHGRSVAMLAGRLHCYEGHDASAIALPIRLLGMLGVDTLVVTNAAGGVNPSFVPGELMLINDHLNMLARSPLVGPNDDRLGPRFPDMTVAYDAEWRALTRKVASRDDIALREGVYAAMLGPAYETPAEIRMLQVLGADAVGMSTVPDVITARHMGMRVLGISCITNQGAGLGEGGLDHSHVKEVAGLATERMQRLVAGVVDEMPELPVHDRR